MTTLGYEERLVEFATGKRLRRFRGVLRAPGDTSCDACGSSMPNFLYGLRDLVETRDLRRRLVFGPNHPFHCVAVFIPVDRVEVEADNRVTGIEVGHGKSEADASGVIRERSPSPAF